MESYIIVILFTAALFCAVVISLAAKRSSTTWITGTATFLAAFGGFFIYGSGFASQIDFFPLTILLSLMASLGMFLGRSDFSAVSGLKFFATSGGQFCFWLFHFLALYATASAALTTIGAKLLLRLRLLLATHGDMTIIYGIHADSVSFGECLAAQRNGHIPIIFADSCAESDFEGRIAAMGGVSLGGQSGDCPSARLLRSLGMRPGKRRLTVYAMKKDSIQNFRYAKKLLNALEERCIQARQTSLIFKGEEEMDASGLLASEEKYGYGSVTLFDDPKLAARLLIQKFPPWETISFDEEGRAREDFDALVVGFGQVGQAVIKSLVMNGQFVGSHFSLTVFASDCQIVSGSFSSFTPALAKKYDITLRSANARSEELYDFLREHKERLKYVVVCIGNQKLNREISRELAQYLDRIGSRAGVYQCSAQGVRFQGKEGAPAVDAPIYSPEILATGRMDRMAMVLNHHYCGGNGLSPQENWERCDYFSRISSRAAADFIPAMLRAAGRTPERVGEDWKLSEVMLENLSRTEHMRWCAFHYAMGFDTMDPETFAARCVQYRREAEEKGKSTINVSKDMRNRLHACLIPWEDLDQLSKEVNEVTGSRVDYKDLDRRNVLALPEVLQKGIEEEERERQRRMRKNAGQ